MYINVNICKTNKFLFYATVIKLNLCYVCILINNFKCILLSYSRNLVTKWTVLYTDDIEDTFLKIVRIWNKRLVILLCRTISCWIDKRRMGTLHSGAQSVII